MSRDVTLLHPKLQGILEQLKKEFPMLLVTDAFRSVEEQNALYAKGRTAPGSIVTNVTGSSYGSQHQWGIAFDFAYNQNGNLYPSSFMNQVASRAKQLGLAWGGDWKSFKDTPHIYMPEWGNNTKTLKSTYGNFENFKKTWEEEKIENEPSKPINDNGIYYRGHVQTLGDLPPVHDGMIMGTIGKGLRLEAFFLDFRKLEDKYGKLTINVKIHLEGKGWIEYKDIKHDTLIGTQGESRRFEAIEVEVIGLPDDLELAYMAHVQGQGWGTWITQGFTVGTIGSKRRVEALKFMTRKKAW